MDLFKISISTNKAHSVKEAYIVEWSSTRSVQFTIYLLQASLVGITNWNLLWGKVLRVVLSDCSILAGNTNVFYRTWTWKYK